VWNAEGEAEFGYTAFHLRWNGNKSAEETVGKRRDKFDWGTRSTQSNTRAGEKEVTGFPKGNVMENITFTDLEDGNEIKLCTGANFGGFEIDGTAVVLTRAQMLNLADFINNNLK
jgi:hypothetical protein